MINLNDKKIRQELVRRYLNAETTLEEERLLADSLSNPNIVLSTEEENVLLLLQSSSLIGIADISSEKADEFDRLTQCGHSKRKGNPVAIRWVVSAAAAVLIAVLIFPSLHINRTKAKPEVAKTTPAKTTPAKTEVKLLQTTKVVNADLTAEDKVPLADATHESLDSKQTPKGVPSHLAERKDPRHEHGENNIKKQSRIEAPESQDISTSELLETIHILSVMETNDFIITASSKNDGFIIKTTNSNESSGTYMLKRSSDGTSIEIKSQAINL